MPRKLKKAFKYKCLELMCNTVHRSDKWLEHCKKKHFYKFKNNIDVKYSVIEVKEGDGPWRPFMEKEHGDGEKQQLQVQPRASTSSNGERSQTTTKDIGGHPEDIGSPSTWDSEGISCDKGESSFENISDQKSLETSMEVIQPVAQDSPRRPIPHFDEKKKNQNTEDEIAPTNPIEFNQNDPQFFVNKKLSPEMINEALKLEQQNLDRIDLASGRKFNTKLKRVLLPNGTTRERNWLVYSKSSDAVFCLHCLIFALPSERTIWSTTGYRGWVDHRGDRDIELHEKSKMHASSQIARLQWISKARVDKDLSKQKDELVNHHRAVLSVIIDCCRYLVNEMLAFRSKDSLDGKLANLFKLLAKYNPDARVYLEKLEKSKEKNKKLSTNLLSYRNLYDLLNVINNIVISKIVERVNETKTFSLIIDSTQDVSKKECTTILLRYVEHRDELAEMKANVKPEERLVNVFTSGDTSGEYLSTKILNTLQKLGIDKNGMVGQSMDGAGNMRGRISGAKSFILRECPKAFYIWCCSHRFALVVEKSMELCPKIRDMFSLLQELYNFMSGHKRHHLFVKKLEAGACEARRKRLKRVNTTRWSSKSESVKTIVSCYDAVRETLEDISEDTKSESESRVSAKGLLKAISDFETYAVMQIVMEVFRVLSPVTICLQSKVIDYGIVPSMVSDTISKLEKMRTDEGWEKITDKINTFSSEHNLRAITNQRIRKRKRFMDELAIDETPTDPMAKLRTNVFFNVLDCVINHLKDRFPENSLNIVEQMIYFSHEKLLEFEDNNLSSNLFKDFCEYYNLDCNIICEELNAFSQLYKVSYRNIDLSDVLSSNNDNVSSSEEETEKQDFSTGSLANLDESSKLVRERYQDQWIKKGFIRPYRCLLNFSGFPYLTNIYQIILSLPATSCSAERTMSKLKIIKNRLRSSMGDMWLSEMLVLSAEKDILKSISNNEIIDKFALSSENRKKLLLYSGYQ